MTGNIRTTGLSGLPRALVQHGRLQGAEAEGLRNESGELEFHRTAIASGRMGTIEIAAFV